jgi:alkylhydroperoxidase family enzyme
MPTVEPVPLAALDPRVRATLDRAVADRLLASTRFLQIVGYSSAQVRMLSAQYERTPPSLLSPRLRELMRLRSAQLAGCAECQTARYEESVTDSTAACMLAASDGELSEAERLVVKFVQKLHLDHDSIDGEFYRQLHGHYSTAEIVELGLTAASLLGMHRFIHTLDLLGMEPPALPYRPEEIDARRE